MGRWLGSPGSKGVTKWIHRNRIFYLAFDGEGSEGVYAVKDSAAFKKAEQLLPGDVLKVVPHTEIEAVIQRYHDDLCIHADADRTHKRVRHTVLCSNPETSFVSDCRRLLWDSSKLGGSMDSQLRSMPGQEAEGKQGSHQTSGC